MDIYDVSGRSVKTYDLSRKGEGRVHLTWDGRDDSGGPVPSGVYFCRMVTPGFVESMKMIKLR